METRTLINVVPYEEGTRYKRVTYEQVKKSCGKRGCSTCHGIELAHGPYWQLVEWDEAGRKKRTRYIGKALPPEAEEALLFKRFLTDPNFRQLVHESEGLRQDLNRRRREVAHLHSRIARLETELVEARARASQRPSSATGSVKLEKAARIYRKLAVKYHPDRNPATGEVMRDINELWNALK